jgi:hypothetical protein
MTKPRNPDQAGGVEKVGRDEEQPENRPSDQWPAAEPKTGKTLQELERIQFDALDRAGFNR